MSVGFKQLSLTRILTWAHFRDRVLEAVGVQTEHPLAKVKASKFAQTGNSAAIGQKARHSVSGVLRPAKQVNTFETDSVCSDELLEAVTPGTGIVQGANMTEIMMQLQKLYMWMSETFSALDLQNINAISIATDGHIIRQAFVRGDLEQLWHALVSEADAAQEINPDRFMKVFVKWMGIEDTWAAMTGLQRSRSRMIAAGALSMSLMLFLTVNSDNQVFQNWQEC